MEKKFNFSLSDMVAENVRQKKEVTFRSLSRYLSIPEEEKVALINSVAEGSIIEARKKNKKHRRLK